MYTCVRAIIIHPNITVCIHACIYNMCMLCHSAMNSNVICMIYSTDKQFIILIRLTVSLQSLHYLHVLSPVHSGGFRGGSRVSMEPPFFLATYI